MQFVRPFCAIEKPEAILRNNTMQHSETSIGNWISLAQVEVSTWVTCPLKGSSVCMSLA